MDRISKMELLAPAGGPRALRAALEAGADAVYFGLKELNARRGAENFTQDNLSENVIAVHEKKAKAYLALNIDLSQRELGEAARQLELTRQCKVDAVLVKDPALLKMIPLFPEIDFHFSTQAGISSSAGVLAAKELGIRRVVLARELSLDEIRSASSFAGVETEVFVQGALCFSVSGRCLLSSWLGGRSGNRGLCASPCRFEWSVGDSAGGRFLSMHDLSFLERLADLRKAGVKALKIEGRLKSPEWISKAVTIYRRAIDNGIDDDLRKQVLALGEYTGRKFTDGYLGGIRTGLTGVSGRIAGADESQHCDRTDKVEDAPAVEGYGIDLKCEDGKLECVFNYAGSSKKYLYAMSVARSQDRAVSLAGIGESFADETVQGLKMEKFKVENPEVLMPRSILRKISNDLSSFLHLALKKADGNIKIKLPADVQQIIDYAKTSPENCPNRKQFNGNIDIARIQGYVTACEFRNRNPGCKIIIDDVRASEIQASGFEWGGQAPVIALPPVFFEGDISQIKSLLEGCKAKGFPVEVNSWDGWLLARKAGVRLSAGPGLSILNSLAAVFLSENGCGSAVVSIEADRQQMEDMALKTPVPLTAYVYGRPVLMITRAEFPREFSGQIFKERKSFRMKLHSEWNLGVFRPELPFDLCGEARGDVAVADFAADLSGAENLQDEFKRGASRFGPQHGTFNYLGRLK